MQTFVAPDVGPSGVVAVPDFGDVGARPGVSSLMESLGKSAIAVGLNEGRSDGACESCNDGLEDWSWL